MLNQTRYKGDPPQFVIVNTKNNSDTYASLEKLSYVTLSASLPGGCWSKPFIPNVVMAGNKKLGSFIEVGIKSWH